MTTIVMAPFSNDDIRDWPAGHYAALAAKLVDRDPRTIIRIVGSASQRLRACEIVRPFDATRVINDCGRTDWPGLRSGLRAAACVVGNNSGIAHIAAELGAPTVCIFGGSHQRHAWRPFGTHAVVVSRAIGCSPCHLHLATSCPYGKACLVEIDPESVIDAVDAILSRMSAGSDAPPPESNAVMLHGLSI